MAKSRYSQEVQEKICDALAVYGLDEAGWKAGEISKGTFYEWQKRHTNFADAVSIAKAEYRKCHSDSLKRLANKALVDYLAGNMVKMSHTKKEVIHPQTGETIEVEEFRTVPVGIPQWAIQRALGDGLTELEALDRLAELQIVPLWVVECAKRILTQAREEIAAILRGILPESIAQSVEAERQHSGGISEDTYRLIRENIMGIESKGVSAVPGTVDSGQLQGQDRSEV